MPHQCVKCSKIILMGSKELLEGCGNCKGHFFFYIRDEQLEKLKENPIEIPEKEKETIEKDIREMAGIIDEDAPVILDLECINVPSPGKFEIDIRHLLQGQPVVYKMEDGKYIIDVASSFQMKKKKN